MANLSVVINTKNAAETFKRALHSVDWADEIIVMDMASSDDTREIAKKSGAKIFTHPDVGYVEPARNAAIAKAGSEWIFVLDADEEIPPTLQEKIVYLIEGDATADAYYIPRKNFVFNSWLYHAGWWPDYQLRLFKKGTVTWSNKIHSQPEIKGKADYLTATDDLAIIHYNYQTVDQYLERLVRYTTYEVTHRQKIGLKSSKIVQVFSHELMTRLFKEQGLAGGMIGVGVFFLQAMYEVVVVLKQWEAQGFVPTKADKTDENDVIDAFRQLQKDLNYWLADAQVRRSTGLPKIFWLMRKHFKM